MLALLLHTVSLCGSLLAKSCLFTHPEAFIWIHVSVQMMNLSPIFTPCFVSSSSFLHYPLSAYCGLISLLKKRRLKLNSKQPENQNNELNVAESLTTSNPFHAHSHLIWC